MTSPAFRFRPAAESDARFIYDLRAAGLREYVAQIWGWDDEAQAARFRDAFDPDRYQVVVVGGRDVGALSVEWRAHEVFLADIEIAPEWRGQGLGTAIITDLVIWARQLGLPVALQVLNVSPARQLYVRLGFEVIGVTPTHYLMRTKNLD
jgi:GNAT superfamily N-acetyltransferase